MAQPFVFLKSALTFLGDAYFPLLFNIKVEGVGLMFTQRAQLLKNPLFDRQLKLEIFSHLTYLPFLHWITLTSLRAQAQEGAGQ
jgi:hypothetical protein